MVSSSLLQGSESLCKLLRFLAEQALDHPGVQVKEPKIATEVFGRPHFDARLDSTVRVQTGRLRSKLAEYYAGPGAEDPVLVEIPKGSYALSFVARAAAPEPLTPSLTRVPTPAAPPALTEQAPIKSRPRAPFVSITALSLALLAALALIVYLLTTRAIAPVRTGSVIDITSLKAFWKGFTDQTEYPWVVFSNAEFTGRPETGMRYFNAAIDSRERILDHYTGVGEVLGVHELDQVFSGLNHGLRVKRGRLLSLDDAKSNNVIFMGSPSENLPLLEIPTSQDFVFRRTDTPLRKGDLAILNVHPRPGEQRLYFASAGVPLSEDYAIVALVPGINQSRQAMLLAGTTTIGTQAAVEYVCRTKSVEDLLSRLTGSKTGPVTPFEAVLKVKVSRGVPVGSQIVALHKR